MRSISDSVSRIAASGEDRAGLRDLARVAWGPAIAALLLSLVGLATVHSASLELQGDFLQRQLLGIGFGLVAAVLMFAIDYRSWVRLGPLLYAAGLGLLITVLFVGREAGGATSWLDVGPVSFQPSELAKFATVLVLARWLGSIQQSSLTLPQILLTTLVVAAPMALIVLQRDLGNAAMFVPIALAMALVAGIRWRIVAVALLVALLGGALAWNFALLDYQRERVATFLDPQRDPLGAGYQLRQSKIAVGSGEVFGRGYMQGTQSQLRFLPARHTDFVFAVLAEEWGFTGVLVTLGLFSWYVVGAARIAQRARDRIGVLLAVGLTAGIAFHVLYNTAMVIGLVPITGIPLPFLSYGGSFMLVNLATTGLLLGVDSRRHANR